ncbi:2,3-bisphosphoglycerate-dependent phosphoglycerate mutase [Halolactibacillus halophilus]|uniref:Phosphoglycerate mutase n=1 Tax=Halolactibacillus halophilus TaxID=306540 RepID=A0A1I5PXK4_9BACI|nr:histidine phosphatase family protein [Halolactibacillus halophilus]GEM02252.1 phosphoglycerate mutase [Halolactibacillus halophilus]SFP38833.1 2,3-bisphosphoglycerate-dependent phosphoglycerate mutase [Halolactibacillus halophilus]
MKVIWIRHAEPDFSVHDDAMSPLTEKGKSDSQALGTVFNDESIHTIYSSPYIRAIETVKPLADTIGLEVQIIDDLRERKITNHWIADFDGFVKKQWQDFSYCLPEGESLSIVQKRNIAVLMELMTRHSGQTIMIGTHGTSLSTIIQYFEPDFGLQDFLALKNKMPVVIEMTFKDAVYQGYKEVDYV